MNGFRIICNRSFLFLLILYVCSSFTGSYSQVLNFEVTHDLIGTGDHRGRILGTVEVPSEGYAVIVSGISGIGGIGYRTMLVRVNNSGNILSRTTLSGPLREGRIYHFESCPNGDYLFTSFDSNYIVVRTDSLGSILWSRDYVNDSTELKPIQSIVPTSDNGMCVVIMDWSGPPFNYYVVRTDSVGDTLWTKSYEASSRQLGIQSISAMGGGLTIAATSHPTGNTTLMRISDIGDTLWYKEYSNNGTVALTSLVQSPDGSYVICGRIIESDPVTWNNLISSIIVKIDSNGNELWSKKYGNTDYNYVINDVAVTSDEKILVTGSKRGGELFLETGDTSQVLFMLLDHNGDILTTSTYGAMGFEEGDHIFLTPNEIFISARRDAIARPNETAYFLSVDHAAVFRRNFFSGTVYADLNDNCIHDIGEPPIRSQVLQAVGDTTWYGISDSSGMYTVQLGSGLHTLSLASMNPLWQHSSCSFPSLSHTFLSRNDTIFHDFPLTPDLLCPDMWVDVSTPFIRFCDTANYYVTYCNNGTQGDSAYIEIEVEDNFEILSATIPWQLPQVGNLYLFNLGFLDISECGNFQMVIGMDCDSIVMWESHCVSAHIYPDTQCLAPASFWDGASVAVELSCVSDDSVEFMIRNVGAFNMVSSGGMAVLEDNILRLQDTFQINAGDSIQWFEVANGSTWYLEADQRQGHPGQDFPRASLEGCGLDSSGQFSVGFLPSYPQNDVNDFIAIDCQQNIGPYDPNDKRGYPMGLGVEHFIGKENKLSYHIRFQNVGTDTAFKVVIRDTLSQYLDIASVRSGASSHPYTFSIEGQNVLIWTFENIKLVDSTTNESESHGFIKFEIDQMPNNPLGGVIENSAAIYFDFNEPVITNTAFHTINEDFWITYLPQPSFIGKAKLVVYPNPVDRFATLDLGDLVYKELKLEVLDMRGQLVGQSWYNNTDKIDIQRNELPSGMYILRVWGDNLLLGTGKMMLR